MPQDAGKFTDAPAVAKDATPDVGNFDAPSILSGEAFKVPESAAEQSDALKAVNPMGAGDTGFDFADAGMKAATELIPDTGDIANTGELSFGGKASEGKAEAAEKGDAKGEASSADGAQEKNVFGNAAFVMNDLSKGHTDAVKKATDGIVFDQKDWEFA